MSKVPPESKPAEPHQEFDYPAPTTENELQNFEKWLLHFMISAGIPHLEQLLSMVEKSRDLILNAINFKAVLNPPKEIPSPNPYPIVRQSPEASENVTVTEVDIDLRPPLQPSSGIPAIKEISPSNIPPTSRVPEESASLIGENRASVSPKPQPTDYTISDLQFGAANPKMIEKNLPRLTIGIPQMTTPSGYMNLIGIVEDIQFNVFRNKNGKGIGIRGDCMTWGLECHLHETKLWTPTIAHLLGMTLDELYTRSRNLEMLRVKFLSLYRGRLIYMNGNFRMYENNAYFNIDEAFAVSWFTLSEYFEINAELTRQPEAPEVSDPIFHQEMKETEGKPTPKE